MQNLTVILIKDSSDSYTIQKINVQNYVIVLSLNSKLEKTIREIDEMINRQFDFVNVIFHGMDQNPSFIGIFDRFKKSCSEAEDEISDEIIFEPTPDKKISTSGHMDPIRKVSSIVKRAEPIKRDSLVPPRNTARIIVPPNNQIVADAMNIIESMKEHGAYPDFRSKKHKTILSCLNYIMTVLDRRHDEVYAEQVRVEIVKRI